MDPAMSSTSQNTTCQYRWEYPEVTNSVVAMSASDRSSQLPYADLSSVAEMSRDCHEARRRLALDEAARAAVRPAPSITYDAFPREVVKQPIAVSDAAARLAGALHLHLN